MPYSTLTRLLRSNAVRPPPKRSGQYHPQPGSEMQHDTSPHTVQMGGKSVKAQCAGAILAYSRKCYVQYYPKFTRFEAQVFLTEALKFFGGSPKLCVIDNTSVVLAGGSGKNAIIAPSMQAFISFYSMDFEAHAINHADRKARIERLFHYVENNFLNARQFNDWADLNQQVIHWCTHKANAKLKKELNSSPDQVFIEQERSALQPLPDFIPDIYESHARVVDSQGYIHLNNHRYSVPEKYLGKNVKVLKYCSKVEVYHQHTLIATHDRILDEGSRRSTIKGHHSSLVSKPQQSLYEPKLLNLSPTLDDYIHAMKKHSPGRGNIKLKQLLHLKREYPWSAFMAAITKAHHYGLYDMGRLEKMVLKQVEGRFFNLEDPQ